jgi:hypothetical protein
MAHLHLLDNEASQPPPKRQKISPTQSKPSISTSTAQQTDKPAAKMDHMPTQMVVSVNGFQPEREIKVGITHFVNHENPGFSGTLKQRYVTDIFLHLIFFQLELY